MRITRREMFAFGAGLVLTACVGDDRKKAEAPSTTKGQAVENEKGRITVAVFPETVNFANTKAKSIRSAFDEGRAHWGVYFKDRNASLFLGRNVTTLSGNDLIDPNTPNNIFALDPETNLRSEILGEVRIGSGLKLTSRTVASYRSPVDNSGGPVKAEAATGIPNGIGKIIQFDLESGGNRIEVIPSSETAIVYLSDSEGVMLPLQVSEEITEEQVRAATPNGWELKVNSRGIRSFTYESDSPRGLPETFGALVVQPSGDLLAITGA